MKQHSESQYDVDLTIDNEDYDESYYSDADDLFEFSTDDESPISRLKSLVLSIDWEITDEVLLQFNEELLDLKDIWAGDTVNLVYVQALEKISKYIYQNKAESHPNAIKLLLTLYYNLEKIVSSSDLSEKQKKEILLEDVKKFESLKRQIKKRPAANVAAEPVTAVPATPKVSGSTDNELINLKAIVLGIDWEITEKDLDDLRREVGRLEEKFAESKPKLILLQGIGTLGGYIKVKKSDSHPDAFKVMQLFYESIEKIVQTKMSLEEEKKILLPAVEKFNAFKKIIGPTISAENIAKKDEETKGERRNIEQGGDELAPALADVAEEESGFHAEKEAMAIGLQDSSGVVSHLDSFFGETAEANLSSVGGEPPDAHQTLSSETSLQQESEERQALTVDRAIALQGVDVEEDDEEAIPVGGATTGLPPFGSDSPALETKIDPDEEEIEVSADFGAISTEAAHEKESAISDHTETEISFDHLLMEEEQPDNKEEAALAAERLFPSGNEDQTSTMPAFDLPDRDLALKGVDVETEADDDSDEASLPMNGEELAPALASTEEESLFSSETLSESPVDLGISSEIAGTIDDLFLSSESPAAELSTNVSEGMASSEEVPKEIEEVALTTPFMPTDAGVEQVENGEPAGVEEEISFEGDIFADALQSEVAELTPALSDVDKTLQQPPALSDVEEAKDLDVLFTDESVGELQVESADIDALFESLDRDTFEEESSIPALSNVEALSESHLASPESSVEEKIDQDQQLFGGFAEDTELFKDIPLSPTLEEQPIEEDVVFELVEEEPVLATEEIGGEGILEEPTAPSTFVNEAEGFLVEEQVSTVEQVASNFEGQIPVSAMAAVSVVETVDDSLEELRACVHSLGLELNDHIITGYFNEINKLEAKWSEQPLERSFLQLLRTVGQHIDNFRYEASSEAHDLLVSLCQKLEKLQHGDLLGNQEKLLLETTRILDWQQRMLMRQAIRSGSQLTLSAPVRTEFSETALVDAQKEFDEILKSYENDGEEAAATIPPVDGEAVMSANQGLQELAGDSGDSPLPEAEIWSVDGTATGDRDNFTEELKKEIAALRQTLQSEISELRKELKKES